MSGLSFSDHSTHEIAAEMANGLTAVEVSPSAEEIERIIDEIAKGKGRRPIVVLAIDGAHVPTRPEEAKAKRTGRTKQRANRAYWKGQWREAKGYRFYLVDNERIVHLISWHQVQTDEELEESLRQIKEAGLIPEDKVRLAVIADGAKWIWRVARELFPSARMVLDYYHCSEHLHKFASVQFVDDEEKKAEWVESVVARLFLNEAEGIIESLQNMETTNDDAKEQLEKLAQYLTNNRKRIDYGRNRKGGYPIGSGGIESANKYRTRCSPYDAQYTMAPMRKYFLLIKREFLRPNGTATRKNWVMHPAIVSFRSLAFGEVLWDLIEGHANMQI